MTTVIRAAEAPRFALPGVNFAGGAAPSRGTDQLCVWRLTVDAGHVPDAHHTLDRDEVFTVLAGRVRFGPDQPELRAGDVAIIRAGDPIAVANPGTEPAELVVAITAGFTAMTADGTPIGTPPWAA